MASGWRADGVTIGADPAAVNPADRVDQYVFGGFGGGGSSSGGFNPGPGSSPPSNTEAGTVTPGPVAPVIQTLDLSVPPPPTGLSSAIRFNGLVDERLVIPVYSPPGQPFTLQFWLYLDDDQVSLENPFAVRHRIVGVSNADRSNFIDVFTLPTDGDDEAGWWGTWSSEWHTDIFIPRLRWVHVRLVRRHNDQGNTEETLYINGLRWQWFSEFFGGQWWGGWDEGARRVTAGGGDIGQTDILVFGAMPTDWGPESSFKGWVRDIQFNPGAVVEGGNTQIPAPPPQPPRGSGPITEYPPEQPSPLHGRPSGSTVVTVRDGSTLLPNRFVRCHRADNGQVVGEGLTDINGRISFTLARRVDHYLVQFGATPNEEAIIVGKVWAP